VAKLMLAFLFMCFVIQFLGVMSYLIFGLAPVPRMHGQAQNDVKPGAGEAPLSDPSRHDDRREDERGIRTQQSDRQLRGTGLIEHADPQCAGGTVGGRGCGGGSESGPLAAELIPSR
jgi:hypothetical protein